MLGEFLYNLTPRDTAVTGLELFIRTAKTTGNTAAQQAQHLVPPGRIFRMTGAHLEAAPGAAQYIVSSELFIRKQDDIVNVALMLPTIGFQTGVGSQQMQAGIADFSAVQATKLSQLPIDYDWQGEIYLPPQTVISHLATYDNIIQPNTTVLTVWGLLIPLGTVVV